jgi:hypothetical protein
MTNFNTYLIEMEITIEGIAMYNVHINRHKKMMSCIPYLFILVIDGLSKNFYWIIHIGVDVIICNS